MKPKRPRTRNDRRFLKAAVNAKFRGSSLLAQLSRSKCYEESPTCYEDVVRVGRIAIRRMLRGSFEETAPVEFSLY